MNKYVKKFEEYVYENEHLTETWIAKLQDNYDNFEEFLSYDEVYNLSKRLGFETSEEAWEANPTIQGSVDPADFKIVGESLVDEGRSKVLNFKIEVKYADKKSPKIEAFGSDSLKQIVQCAIAEKKENANLVYYKVTPQTKIGENMMKGKDYAIIDGNGIIDYYTNDEDVPMYTF